MPPSCQRPSNYYKNIGNLLNHLSNQLPAELYRPKATLISGVHLAVEELILLLAKTYALEPERFRWQESADVEKNETIPSTESTDKHCPKNRSVMCALEVWFPRAKNPGFYRDMQLKKKKK